MDLQARLAQKAAAQKAAASGAPAINPTAEKPTAAPKSTATAEKVTAVELPDGLSYPPWVDPENLVNVNGGCGFNDKGKPCKITDMKAKQAGRPTSDMFEIAPTGDGTVMWVGKDGTPAEGMEGISPLSMDAPAAVKATEKVEAVAEPKPKAEPAPEPEEEDNETESTAKPGRPKKSFVLLINAVPAVGAVNRRGSGRHATNLATTLATIGERMAEELGKESFFDIQVFDRRDAISKYAPVLAEEFKNDMVFVTGLGNGASDMRTLVDALIPLAGMIIHGA